MHSITVRTALCRALTTVILLPTTALANEHAPLPSAVGLSSVAQTIAWLIAVIGLAYACAWAARRFGVRAPLRRPGLIKVLSSTALTPKEKVMVVEIGNTWLVLGVAAGSVRTLHTMPASNDAAETVNP